MGSGLAAVRRSLAPTLLPACLCSLRAAARLEEAAEAAEEEEAEV